MNNKLSVQKVIYWLPRVLSVLFIVFISLFALDVFNEGFSFNAIKALLIHLFPVYILIAVVIIAWKWEIIGGLIYFFLGIFYIIMMRHNFHISWALIISGPLFLTGLLFILNKVYNKD